MGCALLLAAFFPNSRTIEMTLSDVAATLSRYDDEVKVPPGINHNPDSPLSPVLAILEMADDH